VIVKRRPDKSGFERNLEPLKILGCFKDEEGETKYLMSFEGEPHPEEVSHSEVIANCPTLLIDFYERYFVWRDEFKELSDIEDEDIKKITFDQFPEVILGTVRSKRHGQLYIMKWAESEKCDYVPASEIKNTSGVNLLLIDYLKTLITYS